MKFNFQLFFVISSLLFSYSSFCQVSRHYDDLVYLKDGSKYQGEIIENIPNDYIRLKTKKGDIPVLNYDQVASIGKKSVIDSIKCKSCILEANLQIQSGLNYAPDFKGIGGNASFSYQIYKGVFLGVLAGRYSFENFPKISNDQIENVYYDFYKSMLGNKTKNHDYFSTGLRLKVYVIKRKRLNHFIDFNCLYAKLLNAREEKMRSQSPTNVYSGQYWNGFCLSDYNLPNYKEVLTTIKYDPIGTIYTLDYGIEAKLLRKMKWNCTVSYSVLKTSYINMRNEGEVWPLGYVPGTTPNDFRTYSEKRYKSVEGNFALKVGLCF